MIELPIEDLYIYNKIFDVEWSKELCIENLRMYIRACRDFLEKIQKCRFEELDQICSKEPIENAKLFLEWLKCNFTDLEEESKELNKYYNQTEEDLWKKYMGHWNEYSNEYDSFNDYKDYFKAEREEYERHKKINKEIQTVRKALKNNLKAIEIKSNFHVPEFRKMLSYPKAYDKFKEILPNMIKYQKETGKHVFWRKSISEQFLKWYNKLITKT